MGRANHVEIAAVLDKAVDSLLRRGWTQGASARTQTGPKTSEGLDRPIACMDKRASCFCLSGALTLAVYDTPDMSYDAVFSLVDEAILRATRRPLTIAEYNDSVAKNVEDVIRVIDNAKAIAQEGNLN